MSFRFRLEPVLGHRQRVEGERAAQFATAVAEQRAAEASRDTMIERRDAMREQVVREHAQLDVQRLRAMYTHLDYLDRAIVAARQRVVACEAETERARLALVGAAKDRKVLEVLKERRHEAYLLEAGRADQRDVDDQNARSFERARPEGIAP